MEVIICSCLDCDHELGQFRNAWNVIGKTYYSPMYPSLMYEDGFVATGEVWLTKFGSEDTECYLQDIRCKSCQKCVGVRCDSAPEGHNLKQNSILLKLAKMSCISANTQNQATLSILNHSYFEDVSVPANLKKSKKSKSRASTAQPPVRGKSQSIQSNSIRRQSTQGLVMPPPPRPAAWKIAPGPSEFESWAEKAILGQQKDISRLSGTLELIESGMSALKELMEEVRQLRKEQESEAQGSAKQVAIILGSVDELRHEVETLAQKENTSIGNQTNTFNKNSDSLAEDSGHISQKAGEVDGLKAELQQLKAKLQDLETLASRHRETTSQRQSEVPKGPRTNLQDIMMPKRSMLRVEISPLKPGYRMEASFHDHLTTFSSPTDSFDTQSRTSVSRLKRKRGAVENGYENDTTGYQSPPNKRRRLSNRNTKSSGTRNPFNHPPKAPQAPEPEFVEIFSSERDTSPILGNDEENTFDLRHDSEQEPSLPPHKSQTALMVSTQKKKRRVRLTALALSSDDLLAQPRSTPVFRSNQTPVTYNSRQTRARGTRDSDGLLRRPNGKIDRRSVRYRNFSLGNSESFGNKENETPARERMVADELHHETPAQVQNSSRKGFTAPPPVPIWKAPRRAAAEDEPILQSIEDSPASATRPAERMSTPNTDVGTPEVDALTPAQQEKPFGCGVCKKRYASLYGLRKHKDRGPACANTSKDEILIIGCDDCHRTFHTNYLLERHTCKQKQAHNRTKSVSGSRPGTSNRGAGKSRLGIAYATVDAEEARKRVMAAREQLVKETMERELRRPL